MSLVRVLSDPSALRFLDFNSFLFSSSLVGFWMKHWWVSRLRYCLHEGHSAVPQTWRLDLVVSKESIAFGAFLDGPAHAFDLFGGVGFFPVGGRVRFVIGETLFPEEEPMTTAAGMVERLSGWDDSQGTRFGDRRDISCLCRGGVGSCRR